MRAARGLSQKELSTLLEMDPSFISLIESGKRQPSTETLELITRKLNVPFYLFALLSSEEHDLKNISTKDAEEFGKGLFNVLLSNGSD